jgi:hypothetical protein
MSSEEPQTRELVGTGGTKLIPFLRTSRDETIEATIDPSSRQHGGIQQPTLLQAVEQSG